MPAPLSIPILITPDYRPGEAFELEVDGTVLAEQLKPVGRFRGAQGFGFERADRTLFGRLVFTGAETRFGAGLFGVGAKLVEQNTRERFGPGDYILRGRAVDAAAGGGNTSGWSSPITLHHRFAPDPPTGLSLSGATLTWD